IRRGAAHGIVPVAHLPHAQRLRQRQRVREAGLIGLRCNDPDFVTKLIGDALQNLEPLSVYAVVVGQQDPHQAAASIRVMPPMYGRSASGTLIEPSSFW